jgi:amidohydrolase
MACLNILYKWSGGKLLNTIEDALRNQFPQIVSWRRYLHQHPELSFQETETASYIARELQAMGIETVTGVGGNGVLGIIRGAANGPTVALRADIDALPIQDEKTCEYSSKVAGTMHACGHDAHTAALLGVGSVLRGMVDKLAGTVILLFQPAEEVTPGGAIHMIADGALDGVDAIYGVHLWTPFPVGTAVARPGAMMAAADEFVVEVKGKGGHGGLPHQTIDSVMVASHLVVNLQTIVSRSTDPTLACVVSVGSIQGGSSFNIIAETTKLKGTVRTFDPELRSATKERVERILEHTCRMFQADYSIEYKLGYPPVINDNKEAGRFRKVAADLFGDQAVPECPLIMAGEDFSYYLQKVPGCFMFVGAGNPGKSTDYSHHHPRFDIDEEAMLHAGRLLIGMALDRLADGDNC